MCFFSWIDMTSFLFCRYFPVLFSYLPLLVYNKVWGKPTFFFFFLSGKGGGPIHTPGLAPAEIKLDFSGRVWLCIVLKRPCTNLLLLLKVYAELFRKKSFLKLLNKILEKYLNKNSFLVKLHVLMNLKKWIHLHVFFKFLAKILV